MSVVRLADEPNPDLERARELAQSAAGDVPAALDVARELGGTARQSLPLWELLATVASVDLTVARVLEPHLDALGILREAGPLSTPGTWGVFAAEGPGVRVEASESATGWSLSGTKPWCSLAGHLDSALITAHTAGGNRRLFAIDLRDDGVTVETGNWVARGLTAVTSESITLQDMPGTPVGEDEWYLSRPGFAWGGIGVAAIWYGASVALGRHIFEAAQRREPDQVGLMILGEVDRELHGSRAVLIAAGRDVDEGSRHPAITAQRVRSTIALGAERIMQLASHALGPAPLALDEEHARRVADLTQYIRQDHAERDLARLGTKLLEYGELPW